MRNLTDFELSAMSSIGAVVADTYWLANDMVNHIRSDHWITGCVLVISAIVAVRAVIKHRKTGRKRFQTDEDIQYHVKLALLKYDLLHREKITSNYKKTFKNT